MFSIQLNGALPIPSCVVYMCVCVCDIKFINSAYTEIIPSCFTSDRLRRFKQKVQLIFLSLSVADGHEVIFPLTAGLCVVLFLFQQSLLFSHHKYPDCHSYHILEMEVLLRIQSFAMRAQPPLSASPIVIIPCQP